MLSKLHNFIWDCQQVKVSNQVFNINVHFNQWKVKMFSNLHYPLELALLNDPQTAIPSLQIKECNMHHTSRKDDDVELTGFWIFSLLLSTFFIISATMHTDEVRPKRNNRSVKENKLSFIILWNLQLQSVTTYIILAINYGF